VLVELGCRVIFLGDNFYRHEPYTTALQQLGIEVLYGETTRRGMKRWLADNAPYIDLAYLMRPHIAADYVDAIDAMAPRPRRIYFGHDLHYLRLEREAAVSGDSATAKEAAAWRKKEYALFDHFDLVLYPSEVELEAIRKERPE